MELHVFIEVTAPIPDAYLRMAHAMDEVKKFLIPVSGEKNSHSLTQIVMLSLCFHHVHPSSYPTLKASDY